MSQKSVSIQLPVLGILGLIFVTLKLTGHVTWSWLWVLSPFWIPLAFGLGILLLVGVIAFLATLIQFYLKDK